MPSKGTTMPSKSKTELAYAAGIIDGEGCIGFNKRTDHVVLRVSVGNTDPRLMDWLKTTFGGCVWSEKQSYAPNAKPRFGWELSAKKAEEFLRLLLPYLILKRERAELALAYRQTVTRGGRKISHEVEQQRQEIHGNLIEFNRKGLKRCP
jgi:hypothetical protein